MSGAERSLLTLIEGLPDDIQPFVACPPGQLSVAVGSLGVSVVDVPTIEGSLKLHPLHTSRALLDLTRSALAVRRVAKQIGADLVHANTIRASLVACTAARLGGPPAIAHVRDRLPPGRVSDATLRVLTAGARVVIANSRFVASRMPSRGDVRVIPNAVNLDRFTPAATDHGHVRSQLGIDASDFVLAVIGQITPWKDQKLAIRVASELSDVQPRLRLLIVGSAKFTNKATRFDNRGYLNHLQRLVSSLDIEGTVLFLGEREDIPEILAATDLVLLPSWEEPFGRIVVEAMAMNVPVLATEVGGPAEVIRDGVDGLLLPPHRADVWTQAVRALVSKPSYLQEMGQRGSEAAVRFGVEPHVEAMLATYRAALQAA